MARVSLLVMPKSASALRAFVFDHAMEHRNALAVTSPLTRFSAIPYFIDPLIGEAIAAGKYHLNHQQAHNDALRNLPTRYYWKYIINTITIPNPTPPPPTTTTTTKTAPKVTRGLRVGGNLIDFNLASRRQRTWWTFQNHQEHFAGAAVTAPVPTPKPGPQPVFPFW